MSAWYRDVVGDAAGARRSAEIEWAESAASLSRSATTPVGSALLPFRPAAEEAAPAKVEPALFRVRLKAFHLRGLDPGLDARQGDPRHLVRGDLDQVSAVGALDGQPVKDVRVLVAQQRFGGADLVAIRVEDGRPVRRRLPGDRVIVLPFRSVHRAIMRLIGWQRALEVGAIWRDR